GERGIHADWSETGCARAAAGRDTGLSLSEAHDRCLRSTGADAFAFIAAAPRARLQRRARDRLRDELARSVRCRARHPFRVRAAPRAAGVLAVGGGQLLAEALNGPLFLKAAMGERRWAMEPPATPSPIAHRPSSRGT